jgi:hypothetical protein
MKYAALAAALALSVSLAGCAANGALTSAANTDVVNALAISCPIVAVVQASALPLSAIEKSSVATLELACPPNPAPTSAVIAAADIIAAYIALEPVIAAQIKK